MYQGNVLRVREGKARCEFYLDGSQTRMNIPQDVTEQYRLKTGDRVYLAKRYHSPVRSEDIKKVKTREQIREEILKEIRAWNPSRLATILEK
jgi:hypothetical protein